MDAASSDSTSFGTDGADARCVTCVELGALTATSIVKNDMADAASGSELGVDDHAAKLPKFKESAVWSCVCT